MSPRNTKVAKPKVVKPQVAKPKVVKAPAAQVGFCSLILTYKNKTKQKKNREQE